MSIEKTSPEFEEWFKDRFWHECYEDVKHHLFAAWQASRESLAIELPVIRAEDYDPLGNVSYREECRELIEAAGLKVKP